MLARGIIGLNRFDSDYFNTTLEPSTSENNKQCFTPIQKVQGSNPIVRSLLIGTLEQVDLPLPAIKLPASGFLLLNNLYLDSC